MNPRDFCFWLQGYFELSKSNELTRQQLETIKEHLALVFEDIIFTPNPTAYSPSLEFLNNPRSIVSNSTPLTSTITITPEP